MLHYPPLNPVALKVPAVHLGGMTLGPLAIHWYGVMYALAFFIGYYVIQAIGEKKQMGLSSKLLGDLVSDIMLGVIVGGRLGYVLFYGFSYYLTRPMEIFAIWQGGMSFHGGAIGTAICCYLFCRKNKIGFLQLADIVIPAVPIGLGLGRLGNFINAELWGRPSGMPWAMVFPTDPMQLPRHPSQLYELGLEGIALFLILWFFTRRPHPNGAAFGLFLACYGCFRFFIEFFRNPDAQLGFVLGHLSMGQLLSVPMVLIGIGIMVWGYQKQKQPQPAPAPEQG